MCIIVYKPMEKEMPSKNILKTCWENNDDGAGYMFPDGNKVTIKKGFMKFDSFYASLKSDYKKMGRFTPFVLHFRISTQAGVNEQCTHPFPLSREMDDLRKIRTTCDIGIAHNGIIDLTKSGYYTTVTYSDTMKFITDYASLIIKSKDYYKDKDTVKLIDRLVQGKLAIMDSDGHVELIGEFIKDNGIYYSNSYYKQDRIRHTTYSYNYSYNDKTKTNPYGSYYDWEDDDYYFYNEVGNNKGTSNYNTTAIGFKKDEQKTSYKSKNAPNKDELKKLSATEQHRALDRWYSSKSINTFTYDFDEDSCPMEYEDEPAYCPYCTQYGKCSMTKDIDKEKKNEH